MNRYVHIARIIALFNKRAIRFISLCSAQRAGISRLPMHTAYDKAELTRNKCMFVEWNPTFWLTATIQSYELSFCISVERDVRNVKLHATNTSACKSQYTKLICISSYAEAVANRMCRNFSAVLCEVGKLLKRANIVMLCIANSDRLDLQRYECNVTNAYLIRIHAKARILMRVR